MRLIDADAVKESIKKQVDILRLIGNDEIMLYADIIQRGFFREIDNAPTINPEKWISCSERLPEIKEGHESDTVLCYTDMEAYAFSRLQENIFGQCGFECEREDEYYTSMGKVIAWMPLPEPYKEEEE